MSQRDVHHPVTLRRDSDVGQRLYVELIWCHGDGEAHGFGGFTSSGHMEWNLLYVFRIHVDPPELALRPEHDRLVVRHPGEICVHAVDGPGLLHIPIETIEQWPLY